jgi:hypothetical protein
MGSRTPAINRRATVICPSGTGFQHASSVDDGWFAFWFEDDGSGSPGHKTEAGWWLDTGWKPSYFALRTGARGVEIILDLGCQRTRFGVWVHGRAGQGRFVSIKKK